MWRAGCRTCSLTVCAELSAIVSQGADSLRPLLEEAAKYIPQSKWRDSAIALKATAGLRLLSNETAAQILEKVGVLFSDWSILYAG